MQRMLGDGRIEMPLNRQEGEHWRGRAGGRSVLAAVSPHEIPGIGMAPMLPMSPNY